MKRLFPFTKSCLVGHRQQMTPVQETSLLVAYWRMLETKRSTLRLGNNNDAAATNFPSLIRDDLSTVLIETLASDEQVRKFKSSPFLPIGINCLAIRTRIIDDWLLQQQRRSALLSKHAEGQRQQRQVVNLGAGMCTRPYRLDNNMMKESIVYYEVDDYHLLESKRHVLEEQGGHKPRGVSSLVHVGGDVTNMDNVITMLMERGFDPSLPTDWIGEGLFAYVDPTMHRTVFETTIRYSGPGSRFLFTLCDPFCQEYVTHILGVKMAWTRLRPIADVIHDATKAGWSRNVTIMDDEQFMQCYQRTIALPIVIVQTEAADDDHTTTTTTVLSES